MGVEGWLIKINRYGHSLGFPGLSNSSIVSLLSHILFVILLLDMLRFNRVNSFICFTSANEAKQTIEALQSELQKTREKLQAVEELKKQ